MTAGRKIEIIFYLDASVRGKAWPKHLTLNKVLHKVRKHEV